MTPTLADLLVVAAGGALGGAGRYWLSGLVDQRSRGTFPWGTLVVNASGALLIGGLAALPGIAAFGPAVGDQVATGEESALGWSFLAIGVLGSYTTVSSFGLQTLALFRNGEAGRAWWNVTLSFVLCLAGAAVGFQAVGGLLGRWGE